jgi:hypothetical protein
VLDDVGYLLALRIMAWLPSRLTVSDHYFSLEKLSLKPSKMNREKNLSEIKRNISSDPGFCTC